MAPLADPAVGGAGAAAEAGPFTPRPYRVVATHRETSDVVTLALDSLDGPAVGARPGQFNMLTVFGVGEAAISVSRLARGTGPIVHTVRDVGPVTHALCSLPCGALVGVRGPFGTDWPVEDLADRDVVVVAGGIGLAPLRGAVDVLVDRLRSTAGPRRVLVLAGARSPEQIVFADDLRRWAAEGAQVEITVDTAGTGWNGHVGVVTGLLPNVDVDPGRTVAFVCGPEVMMRFTVRDLLELGLEPESVRISLERNMQCGVGLCGHCQLGPLLLCRDGPVVAYSGVVARLLRERQR